MSVGRYRFDSCYSRLPMRTCENNNGASLLFFKWLEFYKTWLGYAHLKRGVSSNLTIGFYILKKIKWKENNIMLSRLCLLSLQLNIICTRDAKADISGLNPEFWGFDSLRVYYITYRRCVMWRHFVEMLYWFYIIFYYIELFIYARGGKAYTIVSKTIIIMGSNPIGRICAYDGKAYILVSEARFYGFKSH